jgi:hypothetical protein
VWDGGRCTSWWRWQWQPASPQRRSERKPQQPTWTIECNLDCDTPATKKHKSRTGKQYCNINMIEIELLAAKNRQTNKRCLTLVLI